MDFMFGSLYQEEMDFMFGSLYREEMDFMFGYLCIFAHYIRVFGKPWIFKVGSINVLFCQLWNNRWL